MENATKFLYMAGGILISLLVFTIAIYLFRGGALMSAQYETKLSDEELKAYNSDFEAYAAKDYVLANDIATLVNKIYDINKKEKENGGSEFISIEIFENNTAKYSKYSVNENTEKGYIDVKPSGNITVYEFIKENSETSFTDNIINYEDRFLCSISGYHTSGKVKSLKVVPIKE